MTFLVSFLFYVIFPISFLNWTDLSASGHHLINLMVILLTATVTLQLLKRIFGSTEIRGELPSAIAMLVGVSISCFLVLYGILVEGQYAELGGATLNGVGAALVLQFVVVFYKRHRELFSATTKNRLLEFAAMFLALGYIYGLARCSDRYVTDLFLFGTTFWTFLASSAVGLVIAYTFFAVMNAKLVESTGAWMANAKTKVGQSLRGMVVGLPLAVCSCGVVPLFRGLTIAGVPTAAAMAFLVATPELGLDSMFISFPLLGSGFAWYRIIAAAILAIAVALIVSWVVPAQIKPTHQHTHAHGDASTRGGLLSLLHPTLNAREFLRGFYRAFGHTAAWIFVGLVFAAAIDPFVSSAGLANVPAFLQIPLFAVIGIPMYVCASGATPMVSALMGKGVNIGAGLAFLLSGPATNVTTFGVVSQAYGRKAAMVFAGVMVVFSTALGFAASFVLGENYQLPQTVAHMHEHGTPLQNLICGVIVAGLLLIFFWKDGFSGFLDQLLVTESTDVDAHCHTDETPKKAHQAHHKHQDSSCCH